MDVSVHRVENEPLRVGSRPRRRRSPDDAEFTLDERATPATPDAPHDSGDDAAIAPRADDEAGSHLDLTA